MDYHVCKDCQKRTLTDDEKRRHQNFHQSEERLEKLTFERQEFLVNEMLHHLKDEYLWQVYKPLNGFDFDLEDLFYNKMISISDIVNLIEKFGDQILKKIILFENIYVDLLFKLIELKYIDLDSLADVLDCNIDNLKQTEEFVNILEFLIDSDYIDLNSEWVARILLDENFDCDDIMKKIIEQYKFDFDEIFPLNPFYIHEFEKRDNFYVKVHKYFPNPNFIDPYVKNN